MEGKTNHTDYFCSHKLVIGEFELFDESDFEVKLLEESVDTLDSSDINVKESLDPMDESIVDKSSHILSNNYQMIRVNSTDKITNVAAEII